MGPVKAPICAIFFSSATFFRCRCIRFDWHFSFLARKKTSTPGHRTDVVPRSGSLLLHELGPLLGFSTTLGLSDCRFLLLKKARISADDLFPHTVHCPTFLSQTDQSLTEKKPAALGNVEVCRTTEVRHPFGCIRHEGKTNTFNRRLCCVVSALGEAFFPRRRLQRTPIFRPSPHKKTHHSLLLTLFFRFFLFSCIPFSRRREVPFRLE